MAVIMENIRIVAEKLCSCAMKAKTQDIKNVSLFQNFAILSSETVYK